MVNDKEGVVEMVVLTQEEIETRVFRNTNKFKNTIGQVTSDIQNKNLKKGRVRPKVPVEAMILNRFTRK